MKVFVAGATGALGRRAVERLVDAGHSVTGVARSDQKAGLLRRLGALPAVIDPFDPRALDDAIAGHDVVMNLATHIPALTRSLMPGAWRENDLIRTELSKKLVDAATNAGAKRYVQESIAFAYEDRGDAWIDEDVPLDVFKQVRAVLDAERQARRFAETGGAGVVLRFGMFLGADTVHTRLQVKVARSGISPFIGRKTGFLAIVHLDDAATAAVASLEIPSGIYNVVDDEPLTRAEAASVLASALSRKRLAAPPRAVVAVGGKATRFLMRSQRVSNERFKKASGWAPSYRSAREGLPTVIGESVVSR
jgi:nucleoside-diphosphate-sugar epimerase